MVGVSIAKERGIGKHLSLAGKSQPTTGIQKHTHKPSQGGRFWGLGDLRSVYPQAKHTVIFRREGMIEFVPGVEHPHLDRYFIIPTGGLIRESRDQYLLS